MVAPKLSVKYRYLELFTCLLSVIPNWPRSGFEFLLGGLPGSNGRRMSRNPCCDMLAKVVKALYHLPVKSSSSSVSISQTLGSSPNLNLSSWVGSAIGRVSGTGKVDLWTPGL